MDKRYKIIISNNNFYKEIELSPEAQQLKVGTGIDCDIRLRKELFFGKIELVFMKKAGEWTLFCSDNLYLSTGDVRKLATIELKHGDSLQIKYQSSDNLAFTMDFLIDFDDGKIKYERIIDLGGSRSISLGYDKSSNIVLRSPFVKKDAVGLTGKTQDSYTLNVKSTTYGVYINGRKAKSGDVLKNGDFLSISDYFFYFKDNQLWTEIREDMYLNGLSAYDSPCPENYPKFNRCTRTKVVVSEDKISILSPAQKPEKPKNNLIMRLMPSIGMLVAAGVMVALMKNAMMLVMSGMSAVMAILTAVMTFRENKKDYKEGIEKRIENYNTYIAEKRREIEQCRFNEQQELEEIYVSQDIEAERIGSFSSQLFDRRPEDDDFLAVRLGMGEVEAKRVLDYKKQETLEPEDELQLIPEQLCSEYKYLHEAPVVCRLRDNNAVGIIGSAANRFMMLKNFVVDLVARQYHSDVKMVFVAEKEHKNQIYWLRLLPNVYNEAAGVRNIVCDDESKNIVFEYLYKELSFREQGGSKNEYIVVFLYDEYGFKSHPVSKFVDRAKELGVCFVFFGQKDGDIPMGCGSIIRLSDDGSTGCIVKTEDRNDSISFVYPQLSDAQAAGIVELMAPVYTEEISLEGSLTKNISLFELLNIIAVDDLDLKKRWGETKVYKSMSAPIGVSKTGIVSLDLHDKAHGPHGLVAGTTGSGKSEILQTYILSMATLFSPTEVGFVIIDFKGGGMVNQFKDLPHLLGAITNIDGKAIDRSLKSIKAELQKRQRLFAEADVNHIDKYIKKVKAGEAEIPLPHLIIIVDEFAELKAEQPEFMKELISAARIGRSLGVHLILATQKPSGQVNEQIWSNSRFKLCLKVQSQQDSNEVIKSPLAAEIKEPGRAYLQVGNNEIFELFQSAYSGAPEKMADSKVREFTIYELKESGRRVPVFSQKKEKSQEGSATQLEAIVNYVHDYCKNNKINKLPDICLPALGETIDFVKGVRGSEIGEFQADLGIYDDPENQYQGLYSVDLATNNLMIIGSSQSGKTNLLQNIIRSISQKYSPEEANIYIIDYASMVLKNFEKLNHVGGVVCPSEDEKLKNLFKLIYSEMELRKEKLMNMGVSSFTAYREAGEKDMPLIVLIVDNLTALRELNFQEDDPLIGLCREGLTVGISVVVANSQTNGIGYRYFSNFSRKIALFCNDAGEYSSLFSHCKIKPDNNPGRCIVEIENRQLECQTYLAFKGEKEIDRVKEIKAFISDVNAINAGMNATRIPIIPDNFNSIFVMDQLSGYMQKPFSLVAGLDYASIMPLILNLGNMGLLGITGREGAGRHNWLGYMLYTLEKVYPSMSSVYLADGIEKRLSAMKDYPNVTGWTMLPEDAVSAVMEMERELKLRYDRMAAGEENVLDDAKLMVLILDSADAIEAICSDSKALAAYKNIVGKYKSMNACVICFVENAAVSYGGPEIIKNIRDRQHLMYFDDLTALKLVSISGMTARNFKKPIEAGDAYYINENTIMKLKTPLLIKEK